MNLLAQRARRRLAETAAHDRQQHALLPRIEAARPEKTIDRSHWLAADLTRKRVAAASSLVR